MSWKWSWMVVLLLVTGCASSPPPGRTPLQEIDRVIELDNQLGALRNMHCETHPIAEAVRQYVRGLNAISFHGAPDDFAAAFSRHRKAWEDSLPFFARYGALRGEMHDVFEFIRMKSPEDAADLEKVEAKIWGTWADVESAIKLHRNAPEPS